MIKVRIDDFPSTRGESQHSIESFRLFNKTLSECIGGKRYLLGVIPGRCTPDHILMLRNETDCVIGMHGTDHDEERLNRNNGNQFENWYTADGIRKILLENREALQAGVGRKVDIYMPPRNVIDRRTIGAAFLAGFNAITTGPETNISADDKLGNGLQIIKRYHSNKPHEYGRSDELFAQNSHLQLSVMPGPLDKQETILTLHWTWERNISSFYRDMILFLTSIPTDRFVDFDS